MYLDDIIIFSQTVKEHLQRLTEVLRRLKEARLKIKPSKCHLLCKSVCYLGYVVSEEDIAADPEKIKCVNNWPAAVFRVCLVLLQIHPPLSKHHCTTSCINRVNETVALDYAV